MFNFGCWYLTPEPSQFLCLQSIPWGIFSKLTIISQTWRVGQGPCGSPQGGAGTTSQGSDVSPPDWSLLLLLSIPQASVPSSASHSLPFVSIKKVK